MEGAETSGGHPNGVSALLNALDFFGKDDPEGANKFKTVAMRALYEQKLDDELKKSKEDNESLLKENASLSQRVRELEKDLETNIDDRERVLAFKTKKIDELIGKMKDLEVINASLLATLQGAEGPTFNEDGTISMPHSYSSSSVSVQSTRNSMMEMIKAGKGLFHPLETCREQEYRQKYEEKHSEVLHLTQELKEYDNLSDAMAEFRDEKSQMENERKQLKDDLARVQKEKEDEVAMLERKLVTEHIRLAKEKQTAVRNTEEAMQQHMLKQLDVTTQQTIKENERVQIELRYQNTQVDEMVRKMERLEHENASLKQDKQLTEMINSEITKKLGFYQQLIARLQNENRLLASVSTSEDNDSAASPGRRHSPRKPPLPLLKSPRRMVDDDDILRQHESTSSFHTNEGNNQLNNAVKDLAVHIQKRDYLKHEIAAILQSHHDHRLYQEEMRREHPVRKPTTPIQKRKVVLAKPEAYSPRNFQRRRKLRMKPTRLDAFVQEHARIPSRRQEPRKIKEKDKQEKVNEKDTWVEASNASNGPNIELVVKPPTIDTTAYWKASKAPTIPNTARF